MSNFTKNPLYRRASREVQKHARREWNKTTAARAINQVHTALRTSSSVSGGTRVRKAIDQWSKSGLNEVAKSTLLSSDFATVVREVQKYVKMGGTAGNQIRQLLGSLGPIGSLITSVLSGSNTRRSSGLDGDIQSALEFLDAVAPETLSGGGRKRSRQNKPIAKRNSKEVAEQIELAAEFLQQQGYEVKPQAGTTGSPAGDRGVKTADDPAPNSKEKTYPGGTPKTTNKGAPRKVVDLDIEGTRRRFSVSHPIVTKRMIPTPESSNVFSYSYDIDSWTLYVRYKSHMVYGTAGSLYSYSNVPPTVFLKMYNAPSKGTFIWDNIRIRRTISGHRYDYKLVAIRQNYVPRKATVTGDGERLIQRNVKVKDVSTGKIRTLKSGGDLRPGAHLHR